MTRWDVYDLTRKTLNTISGVNVRYYPAEIHVFHNTRQVLEIRFEDNYFVEYFFRWNKLCCNSVRRCFNEYIPDNEMKQRINNILDRMREEDIEDKVDIINAMC